MRGRLVRQLELRPRRHIGRADGDELDLAAAVGVAVALLVRAIELLGNVAAKRDGELEGLPAVAHVRLALRRQIADRGERTDVGDDSISALLTRREPEGRQDTGRGRNEHRLDPELLGERARVERPRAAVRDEGEVARIVAALDGDDPQCPQHLCLDDRDDRRRIDPVESRGRRVAIENEPAWQLHRETAEEEVRVGDRRAAAAAVTRRPGIRARRLRPDMHRATGVAPHERAAARADGVDVDRRQPDGHAADLALRHPRRAAARQRHTSVDVPPMSNAIASAKPARRASSPAPTTPPAGPETSSRAGCAAASPTGATPPDESITTGSGSSASSAARASAWR